MNLAKWVQFHQYCLALLLECWREEKAVTVSQYTQVTSGSRIITMPYIVVKERYNDVGCVVEGLSSDELRQIIAHPDTDLDQTQRNPGEKYRKVEFSTPSYSLLNALEQIGYR